MARPMAISQNPVQDEGLALMTDETEFPDTDDELSYPSYARPLIYRGSQTVSSRSGEATQPGFQPSVPMQIVPAAPAVPSAVPATPCVSLPLVGVPMGGMLVYGYCVALPVMVPLANTNGQNGHLPRFHGEGFNDDSEIDDDTISNATGSSGPGGYCSDCITEIVDECEEPLFTDDADDVCTICLDSFHGQRVCLFPVCLHRFHRDCLKTCLRRHPKCPNCRQKIL